MEQTTDSLGPFQVRRISTPMTRRSNDAWVSMWILIRTRGLCLPPYLTCVLMWLRGLMNSLGVRQLLRSLPLR